MRRPPIHQLPDQPASQSCLADYFWIAGLDGQDLLNTYLRLASNTSRPSSYGIDNTIQEDIVAENDSASPVRSPISISRHGSKTSYHRLSQLSDEARLSMLSLDANPVGTASNRSSATARGVSPLATRMSVAISDADFEKALSKFTNDREKFYLDLSFRGTSPLQSPNTMQPKPRPRTQKIVAEETPVTPTRALGSIRRHISFKELSSVKRQPSLARNSKSRWFAPVRSTG